MRHYIYQRKKILQNTFCFECKEKVTTRLPGDMVVMLNHYPYFIHAKCAGRILSAYIVDQKNREADTEQKFSQRRNADLLADTLGYQRVIRDDSE